MIIQANKVHSNIIGVALLLVSSYTSASLITHNNYTLDTDTHIVSSNGTEWLQWSETQGSSVNEALKIYGSQGWKLAGNSAMATLFLDFGFDSGTVESSSYKTVSAYTPNTENSEMDKFITLFGWTYLENGRPYGGGADARKLTEAYYGDDEDGDGLLNLANVDSDYNGHGWISPNAAYLYNDKYRYNETDIYRGVALIRVQQVPEPTMIFLFALGLTGLVLQRRRKNKLIYRNNM